LAYNWFYFKDRGTPAIDYDGDGLTGGANDGTAFADGEDYITIRNGTGIHSSQGSSGYFPASTPDYVYLEANFSNAAAQTNYRTVITVEFFLQ
jgi:hypothetical protein